MDSQKKPANVNSQGRWNSMFFFETEGPLFCDRMFFCNDPVSCHPFLKISTKHYKDRLKKLPGKKHRDFWWLFFAPFKGTFIPVANPGFHLASGEKESIPKVRRRACWNRIENVEPKKKHPPKTIKDTLPKTNSSPLKIGRALKGKVVSEPPFLQVLC